MSPIGLRWSRSFSCWFGMVILTSPQIARPAFWHGGRGDRVCLWRPSRRHAGTGRSTATACENALSQAAAFRRYQADLSTAQWAGAPLPDEILESWGSFSPLLWKRGEGRGQPRRRCLRKQVSMVHDRPFALEAHEHPGPLFSQGSAEGGVPRSRERSFPLVTLDRASGQSVHPGTVTLGTMGEGRSWTLRRACARRG